MATFGELNGKGFVEWAVEWEAFWTRLEQRLIAWSEARGGFEVVCPALLQGRRSKRGGVVVRVRSS